jgi:ubiquitin C-terminal hydrolase
MNAVLQALVHAPELCLAMDCEPHHLTCPIAAENAAKLRASSPSSSPDDTNTANPVTPVPVSVRKTATRKSRRSGRKTPPEQPEDKGGLDLKFCALCEVEEHFRHVHDSSNRDSPVAPSAFVNGFIHEVAPWFKLGVQEDSHEFLRLLIDAMQKSCHQARVTEDPQAEDPQAEDPDTATATTTTASTTDPQGAADKEEEYSFSLFRGTVESNVTCDFCQASSSTLDPIEDVGLEVTAPTTSPATASTTTSRNNSPTPTPALADVQSAFQRFARAEALDAGYKCEQCGKVGRATKQVRERETRL